MAAQLVIHHTAKTAVAANYDVILQLMDLACHGTVTENFRNCPPTIISVKAKRNKPYRRL
jgi:hypothetical protein